MSKRVFILVTTPVGDGNERRVMFEGAIDQFVADPTEDGGFDVHLLGLRVNLTSSETGSA